MQPEIRRILAIGDAADLSLLMREYPRAHIVEVNPCRQADPASLIQEIQDGAFDAAFVFTGPPRSPWELAYCCYLAGVPRRFGISTEFGGGLLSHFPWRPA